MDKENLKLEPVTCSICFTGFNDEIKIVTLNCGHYFCTCCLGNFKFSTFFKCSICRSINTNYNFSNDEVVKVFNRFLVKEDNSFSYCPLCYSVVDNTFHKMNYPSHKSLSLEEVSNKVMKISCLLKIYSDTSITKILNSFKVLFESKYNQERTTTIDYVYKTFYEHIEKGLNTTSIEDDSRPTDEGFESLREKLRKLYSLKKSIRKLKNKKENLSEIVSLVYKSHKFWKSGSRSSNKYIAAYLNNTKKVAIFDTDMLEVNFHEINQLPFNFFKNSHTVEYDQKNNIIYIVGGKQENFIYSHMSGKIWQYDITNSSLTIFYDLQIELTAHRSILVDDFLYIIGGRQGKTQDPNESFYDRITKLNLTSQTPSNNCVRLTSPRANFGIAYNNYEMYVCFGITNRQKFLTNIEIIPLNRLNSVNSVVEIKDLSPGIKDVGVISNNEKEEIIILGGEKDNQVKNSTIYSLNVRNCEIVNSYESKEIISATFLGQGTKYKEIFAALSNSTVNEDLPHVYLMSDMNKKWTCHGIDIY